MTESGTGLFITFEGGEGVGKTTQIKRLQARLEKAGYGVTVSREPGGTPGAEAIRNIMLDRAGVENFGPRLEAMLFAASRNDHVNQVIRPALARGEVVLIDRFMDSTRVYQGASNALPSDFMAALERVAVQGTVPDLTFILDLDPQIGLSRAHARREGDTPPDRFEKETLAVHEKRRKAFLEIAKREPDRCKVIDASQSPDEMAAAIWQFVNSALAARKGAA